MNCRSSLRDVRLRAGAESAGPRVAKGHASLLGSRHVLESRGRGGPQHQEVVQSSSRCRIMRRCLRS
eukprot:12642682-Alexandrium_andersonii.AAC.1